MLNQLALALVCLFVILLVLLWYSHSSPEQGDEEGDDEYNEKLKNYNCSYGGNRNFLYVGLAISLGLYAYDMVKNKKKGILVEVMGGDEPSLFRKKLGESEPELTQDIVETPPEKLVSDASDAD